jgi:hypothetical protein
MDLRLKASECRREPGRLEQLARAARDHGWDHCCRDLRAIEQQLIAQAIAADQQARALEAAAAGRRRS